MHLKDKLRKAFNSSTNSSPPREGSEQLVYRPAEPRWPSNVYRWDEPMPRLKYRGPVKVEHKKKLEAYQLGFHSPSGSSQGGRRRSHMSDHSPMSSRHQSRRSSISSIKNRNSMQGRRASHSLRVRTSITAATAAIAAGVQHTPPSASSPRDHKRHMRESLFINAAVANNLNSISSSNPSTASTFDPNSPSFPLSPTSKVDSATGAITHVGSMSSSSTSNTHENSPSSTFRYSKNAFQGEVHGAPLTPPKSPLRNRDMIKMMGGTENTSNSNSNSKSSTPPASASAKYVLQHQNRSNVFYASSPANGRESAGRMTPVATPKDARFGTLYAH